MPTSTHSIRTRPAYPNRPTTSAVAFVRVHNWMSCRRQKLKSDLFYQYVSRPIPRPHIPALLARAAAVIGSAYSGEDRKFHPSSGNLFRLVSKALDIRAANLAGTWLRWQAP